MTGGAGHCGMNEYSQIEQRALEAELVRLCAEHGRVLVADESPLGTSYALLSPALAAMMMIPHEGVTRH